MNDSRSKRVLAMANERGSGPSVQFGYDGKGAAGEVTQAP